jgi:SAM-dependent methyltransferase
MVTGSTVTGRRHVFGEIYRDNLWGENKAGKDSTLEATQALGPALKALVRAYDIRSVLDAGCNEALWQPELPGYIGVDIVPEALEVAQERHPTWSFMLGDVVEDHLPMVDAIMCRHVLQHLSIEDALKAVDNFRDSGARYLIASTNHRDKARNVDTPTGGFFRCYLPAEPFNLGPPLASIPDVAPMTLDLWPL